MFPHLFLWFNLFFTKLMTDNKPMSRTRVFHLLLVDDDSLIHQSVKLLLPEHWRLISAKEYADIPFDRFFHAAFVDMHLNAHSKQPLGVQVIKKLNEKNPLLEIIAISGDLNRELMESCLKVGAQRFLSKPLSQDELLLLLGKIEALWELRSLDPQSHSVQWIGQSAISQKIKRQIASLKGEMAPILIEGETGTGKEVVARLLNLQENERPFVSINMATLPENLFESEMFGHMKGSFTGADQNKIGLCEAAHGGDLFLDEIEALPLVHQAKLLRFLESGEIRKVGAKDSQRVQCRVIVASNKSLTKMVESKSFREDLYFRISAHRFELPPLQRRKEDISELAQHFLKNVRPQRNKSFSQDGLDKLAEYHWPGNIRELKRVCEQLSLVSPLPLIRGEDVVRFLKPAPVDIYQTNFVDLNQGLAKLLENFEKSLIQKCLQSEKDVEKAAMILKISRSSLYKKIKDFNIDEGSL